MAEGSLAPSSLETSEELFDKVVAVNFKGPFRLSALVATRMREAGGGSVINVSSSGALRPSPTFGPYAGSKAALNAVTVAFAQEYAPTVRFNVISPGGFYTDISKGWATPGEDVPVSPLRRFGHPPEIVTAALYFASDASSCARRMNASSRAIAASGTAASCSRNNRESSATVNERKLRPAEIPVRLSSFNRK